MSADRSRVATLVQRVVSYDNVVFWAAVLHLVLRWLRTVRAEGMQRVVEGAYTAVAKRLFRLLLLLPANKRRMQREMDAAAADIEKSLLPPTDVPTLRRIPTHGYNVSWLSKQLSILERLGSHGEDDGRDVWRHGQVSGTVYHGGEDLNKLLLETLERFLLTNPLHPDVFPGVRKMEAEVVSMVLNMYRAPSDAAGTTTSGGTESIMMACLAMRAWGRAVRGIRRPEIVIPASAHVAFDKAGYYFSMVVRRIPVDRTTRKVRLDLMQRAINANTVLLVGSAPNFPDGIIDDIVGIASLAKYHGIGCHVDCCLGSFLMPFLDRAGFVSEPFDFRVDGVTSISCDTHKYGFAPKGSSVVMYHTSELRRYQYYVNADWVGGVYASPTLAGSRPGALIAGTWAAMLAMGEDGYTESCRAIVGAARAIEARIRAETPELKVLGKPLVSVVAFASAGQVNIYDVGDQMSKRGWHLNALGGDIPSLHIACTRLTVPAVDQFMQCLKESVAQSRSKPAKPGTMATVYGLSSSSAVGPMLIGEMAARYIDTLYKLDA